MKYVTDKKILDMIGCTGDMFAVYSDGFTDDEFIYSDEEENDIQDEISSLIDDIDDSHCNGEFEKSVECRHDNLRGGIFVYSRNSNGFPRLERIYDSTGMFRMADGISARMYRGYEGRSLGIFIPQCKMMNSTVLDDDAEHPVYHVVSHDVSDDGIICYGESGINHNDRKKNDSWMRSFSDADVIGTHISFEAWSIVGAVFGKFMRIWRGECDRDTGKMPGWMVVTVREIFETMNPGCRWIDLSMKSRILWMSRLSSCFSMLDETGLFYDLPDKEGGRKSYCMKHILQNSLISRYSSDSDMVSYFGDSYVPWGFKVRVSGGGVFDFCWRNGKRTPSLVQLRPYDYDIKDIFGEGSRGWTRCFNVIWAAWLVQYRNYWVKHEKAYPSCCLQWSQKEMKKGFSGGFFEYRTFSTDEMLKVIEWYSVDFVFRNGGGKKKRKRHGHVGNFWSEKRCVVKWELPESLAGEPVLLKNENGVNVSLSIAGIRKVPEEVGFAMSRMKNINNENMRHSVTLDGKDVPVSETVIYRSFMNSDGSVGIDYDHNGRCYSSAGGVQSLHKADRKRILIDGHDVVEVDYSSLHPSMLYSLNGKQFLGNDMYDVGQAWHGGTLTHDEERLAVKMMMMRMVNTTKAKAVHSFKTFWNIHSGEKVDRYIPWLFDLYDAIMAAHAPIAHEFSKCRGTYLMNLDGKLIREVCWRLTREKICALAIHDSVIVDSRFAERAKEIMIDEYVIMIGGFVKVKM